jgi:guanyl-specific ribonuclease Sa
MRKSGYWLAALLLLAACWWLQRQPPQPSATRQPTTAVAAGAPTPSHASAALPAFLPPEAHATLRLIAQGGPFPHPQDGSVFGNREGRLPPMPRGYYREYTVETPGLDYRGARRIIAGGDPPVVYYYTEDHYNHFRAFEVQR